MHVIGGQKSVLGCKEEVLRSLGSEVEEAGGGKELRHCLSDDI